MSLPFSTINIDPACSIQSKTVNNSVKRLQSATQQMSTASLGKGIYFYRAMNEAGQMIRNGKIVKQ